MTFHFVKYVTGATVPFNSEMLLRSSESGKIFGMMISKVVTVMVTSVPLVKTKNFMPCGWPQGTIYRVNYGGDML